MKLYFKCKRCNRENDFDSYSTSRMELEDKVGRYFTRQCKHCQKEEEYHINEIIANESKGIAFYGIGGISIIFTLIILFTAGLIFLLMLFPLWYSFKYLNEIEARKVKTFNKILISRTRN